MRFELFAVVMLLTSLSSGCLSQDDYIGTYRLDKTPSKTLEIREDGTYLLVPEASGHTQKGVYIKRGTTLEVTNVLGFTSVMNITDKGLVEDNGDRWVRVTQK
ncbi:MAG: hypothetical protein C3F06_14340 [Candidatus Methanoperedenaceae archaeon]|nr:MAG: hypothetical protein C3F06_14340 [Candidatus Methanoperedenaceae archaeon]